jgi:hypothetical protein
MRAAVFLFFALIVSNVVQAQVTSSDHSRIVDELIALQDEEADYETTYENLMQLLAHPVDINKATAEELREYHLLSEAQVSALIRHRESNGKFLSIYELQSISEFDQETIERIRPFIRVTSTHDLLSPSAIAADVKRGSSYLIARWERTLEQKSGYDSSASDESRYLGTPDKVYLRFRSSLPGRYSAGFTLENDGGEQFRFDPSLRKFGTDFSSAHIQVSNRKMFKTLIVGDFQAQFGQGIVFGSAFGLGKGAETISTVRRNGIGFVPHTSAAEGGFFRGAGTTLSLGKHLTVSALLSDAWRDSPLSEATDGSIAAGNINNSGNHRNLSERQNERTLREQVFGSVLEYKSNIGTIGILAQHVLFDKPIMRAPNQYNQFAFSGRNNTNVGVHVTASLQNFNLFGEAAQSIGGGLATVTGLIGSLNSKFDVSLVYRHYQRNFFSFYGNPFSENTQPVNEQGWYVGWKYRWNKRYNLAGYVDLFRFPWLSFRRYQPSDGHEWLLRFNYQPSRKVMMFVQCREETKLRNSAEETRTYEVLPGTKRNYWLAIHYDGESNISLRSRVQYSTFDFNTNTTGGLAIMQSVSVQFGKLQVAGNYSIFRTDDFDNRQYAYENDVQLAFSLPAYDGKGIRNYLIVEYKITKALTVWLRYARTRYIDRDEIGSGLETIEGNTRNDVKFQSIFNF